MAPRVPFCLEIDAEYGLGDEACGSPSPRGNRGSQAAPYGTGSHPYLTAGAPSVDGCQLSLPASKWLPMDERGIPSSPPTAVEDSPYDFRQPRAIGGTRLDHALTGLHRAPDGRVSGAPGRGRRRGQQGQLVGRGRLPLAAGVHRRPART